MGLKSEYPAGRAYPPCQKGRHISDIGARINDELVRRGQTGEYLARRELVHPGSCESATNRFAGPARDRSAPREPDVRKPRTGIQPYGAGNPSHELLRAPDVVRLATEARAAQQAPGPDRAATRSIVATIRGTG
jgi:hypothetical protein